VTYLLAFAGLAGAFAAGYLRARYVYRIRLETMAQVAADAVFEAVVAGEAMARDEIKHGAVPSRN